ncbi:MAG: cytochrome C [Rhodospirillales bacterium]|jgi:cytochrome b subunit of formate dehydrogenase|nr:cytochrome C [Rhodospirillales bacterium]
MADTTKRLIRFTPIQRLWHLGLIFIFILMTVTGFAWMYVETHWGQTLASWFGGIKETVEIHKIAGLVLLAGFVLHILYALCRVDWSKFPGSLYSPDLLMMGIRDFGKMIQHMGWTIGLCKAPRFERWAWWEKFDYWAVWWGFTITGITGLMLYNPVLTSDYMPGWMLNLALWIHRIEAVLAIGHVFTIHFLMAHMRPGTVPFNGAMFDGTITMSEARHDHPEWVARLEKNGELEAMSVPEPSVPLRVLYFGVGYIIMAFAVTLLAFAVINITAVTLL